MINDKIIIRIKRYDFMKNIILFPMSLNDIVFHNIKNSITIIFDGLTKDNKPKSKPNKIEFLIVGFS
ncbi:MAG: hypothetical protein DRJ01_11305, partial [Bacteroidetes bacterium]